MVIYDQIFVYFIGFLSMAIYVVILYTQCLRYNICSAWFLDNIISTCCSSDQSLLLFKLKIFVLITSLSSTSDLKPSTAILNLLPGKSVLDKFKPY